LQLKPVHGDWIFDRPLSFINETHLWKLFELVQLEQNQRQIGDTAFGELCGRIRIGKHNSRDIEMLQSRMLNKLANKSYFDDAIVISARKESVRKHNLAKFQELKSKPNTKSYTINSNDVYTDGNKDGQKADPKDVYLKEEQCGGMNTSIELAIGF
jgi:hypothetical protein